MSFLVGALIALSASGCRPDYPSCETDKDCREKEFCVGRKCQQCRETSDCPQGQACSAGKCGPIAGYCGNSADCPDGKVCSGNRCRPCAADTECSPGAICHKGTCKNAKRCASVQDCAESEDCVDGLCTAARASTSAPGSCELPTVLFDFNEATLTSAATARLAGAADCLKRAGQTLKAVGHADPRGTQEYNLALSERRARAVREHLGRLGVDSGKVDLLPRGSLDAKGTDERGWANDRRVELVWQ